MLERMKEMIERPTFTDLKKHWTDTANNLLQGLEVTQVKYEENEEGEHGIVICLNHKVRPHKIDIQLTIMSDDEGNGFGSIHTNVVEVPVLPIL